MVCQTRRYYTQQLDRLLINYKLARVCKNATKTCEHLWTSELLSSNKQVVVVSKLNKVAQLMAYSTEL